MNIQIKSTVNYTQWKDSNWQPEKRVQANNELAASIKITNGNMYVPALVDMESQTIIDGHRRLQACRMANVPFYYIEVDSNIIGGREAIKMLNTTSRQWSLLDFMSSYAVDNDVYKTLKTILLERKVPTSLLTSYYNIQAKDIKAEAKIDIDFKDLEHKIDVFKVVCGIYSHVSTNYIHRALGKLYRLKDFNEERLLNKLAILVEHNGIGGTIQQKNFFLKELCTAYDYKQRDKAHLFHKLVEQKIVKD